MDQKPRRIQYTDLDAWKKASEFSAQISKETSRGAFSESLDLRRQLYRSALSIPSNIAEGEGQGTNRGTLKFYFIARGSLSEAKTQLQEALNRNCISRKRYEELVALGDDVARLIAGVIRSRRAREDRPPKDS